MTRSTRVLGRALCAAALAVGLLSPLPARAQVAREVVAGVEVVGGYLVHSVTATDPVTGGGVVVDNLDAFDPDGGLAIFEPASDDREVFTYGGIDPKTTKLTGVVRTTPEFHPNGSFVQAIENARPSPKPSESPSSRPKPNDRPSPKPSDSPRDDDRPTPSPPESPLPGGPPSPKGGFGNAEEHAPLPRSFTSAKLVTAAAQLHALGWTQKSARVVYRPFPVAGPATFTNTWGAERHGPAPGQIRTHEGQDIFCEQGAAVLAVTPGWVQFDNDGLGGRIARLRMRDGSYWYYAHLSGWNEELSSGDRVGPGDVIGFCGRSGNAMTTPPHLHFGWYSKEKDARNPMRLLVGWLRTAEDDARSLVTRVERRVARRMELQMLGRMFGDSWAPDLSTPSPSPSVNGSPTPSASASCDAGVVAPSGPDAAPCIAPNALLHPSSATG